MKIEHIRKLPKGKYKLTFDNGDIITLYEDVIINHVLLIGKSITTDLYSKIMEDNYKEGAYQQALQHIDTRMRSEEEIRNYLLKKEYENALIETTIIKLNNNGYINDCAFATAYVNDRLSLSNDGTNKIRKALLNYGVDEGTVHEALSNIQVDDLKDKITRLIAKQLRLNTKYTGNILKGRILNYLINLGYDSNLVLEILGNYDFDRNGDIQKEYQKLYKKYANKYTGYKLDMTIKQKLYQKGYSEEELNNIK